MNSSAPAACPLPLQGKFVVITTFSGKIYSQPLVASVSANEGPVYFTVELAIQYRSIKTGSDGNVNGGGASVYYSQTLKMLFFSYLNGKIRYQAEMVMLDGVGISVTSSPTNTGYKILCEIN